MKIWLDLNTMQPSAKKKLLANETSSLGEKTDFWPSNFLLLPDWLYVFWIDMQRKKQNSTYVEETWRSGVHTDSYFSSASALQKLGFIS